MPPHVAATALPPALAWRWRIVRGVVTLAAGAVLALVAAHWIWHWWGPAPELVPPLAEPSPPFAPAILAAPWFGSAAGASAPGASETPDDTMGLGGGARLLGIIAGRDGEGYALFRLADRGAVLVHTGQDIARGVTLDSVSAEGIRVRDRGELRAMSLRPASVAIAPVALQSVGSTVMTRGAAGNAACMPPSGARGPVYRLNAELLTGIAARPESWSGAFVTGRQGLTVREGNALAAMLGMRGGDRVTQANGVALHGADDVVVAVIRPLLASQAVHLAGIRDGKPVNWIFVNAGACPA